MVNQSEARAYEKLFSLEGKTAIVTGGAGHLGSAISKGLAAAGAKVFVLGRTKETLSEFVEKNKVDFGGRFEYRVCDVTDDKKFREVIQEIESSEEVDILVNNAYGKQNERFEDLTVDQWESGMKGGLTHCFTGSQEVMKGMARKGRGSIINIGSIYGFLGIDMRKFLDLKSFPPVHYAAAKGGLLEMTKYLATLSAPMGIRVNAISPGCFPKRTTGTPERLDYMTEICSRTPMRRIGKPSELAGAAIFLASNASSFVTGQNIVVDGGWSAW